MEDIKNYKDELYNFTRILKILVICLGICMFITMGVLIGLYAHQSVTQDQILKLQQINDAEHEIANLAAKRSTVSMVSVSTQCKDNVEMCYQILKNVENISKFDNIDIVYEYMESLEPQSSRDIYWMHHANASLSSNKRDIQHGMLSVVNYDTPFAGWDLIIWNIGYNISYGVSYCKLYYPDNDSIKICGAFSLYNFNSTSILLE